MSHLRTKDINQSSDLTDLRLRLADALFEIGDLNESVKFARMVSINASGVDQKKIERQAKRMVQKVQRIAKKDGVVLLEELLEEVPSVEKVVVLSNDSIKYDRKNLPRSKVVSEKNIKMKKQEEKKTRNEEEEEEEEEGGEEGGGGKSGKKISPKKKNNNNKKKMNTITTSKIDNEDEEDTEFAAMEDELYECKKRLKALEMSLAQQLAANNEQSNELTELKMGEIFFLSFFQLFFFFRIYFFF